MKLALIGILLGIGWLMAPLAFSNATFQLQGRVTSVTDTQIVLETEVSIYYLDRNQVFPKVDPKLTRNPKKITLMVPMNAIEQIRSKPSS